MVEVSPRRVSRDKYIVAAVITLLIFSLGLTLGFIFDKQRYQLIEEINLEQEIKYNSLQLQYLFLTSQNNLNVCPALSTTLKEAISDLDDSLSRVIAQEEDSDFSTTRDVIIQRRYVIDNLRYWLLARESKEKCDLNIVTILYFYTEKCSSCPNQGTILTYFKQKFGEKVLVFPINLDLREEEAMVEIMRSQYNVEKYPTLVIDGKKYEGVIRQEELQKIICSSLKDTEECTAAS